MAFGRKKTKQKTDASTAPVRKKNGRGGIDMPFLILVLCLLGFGLVMVCSASYVSAYYNHGDSFYFIKRQAIWAVAGIAAMFFFAFFDYRWFRKKVHLILIVAFILVIIVLIPHVGITVNGARRWLGAGPIRFQPSEVAKFAVIVFLASYISTNYGKMKKFREGLMPALAVLAAFVGLVAVETHFSGAILIFGVGVTMLFVGGTSIKTMLGFAGVGAGGIGIFVFFTDYATRRLEAWLHPEADPQSKGFQILQSLYAISSGGLLGLGLGQSRQKHLYIPEPQNDYIFSIVCEELGFIGALVVILLFALLIWRGFTIAFRAKDKFSSMLTVGIISHVALQTILNIGVVSQVFPSTGIGLPFFSYGGTALLVLMAEMGIVLSVSRNNALEGEGE